MHSLSDEYYRIFLSALEYFRETEIDTGFNVTICIP